MSDTPSAAHRRHGKSAEGYTSESALRARMRAWVVAPAAASGALALSADYVLHHASAAVGPGPVLGGAVALSCGVAAAGWGAVGRIVGAVGRQRAADMHVAQAQLEAERRSSERALRQIAMELAQGIKAVEETLGHRGLGTQGQHGLPALSGSAASFQLVEPQIRTFVTCVQEAVDTAGRQERAALVTIGRRMIGLLATASAGFDALVRTNEDPGLLEQVWQLDHMVVRARRMAQSFALVGGARPQRSSGPVSLFEVVGHAIGEVEYYRRVTNDALDLGVIRGEAAAGIAHLLAELIDNAANFSPPHTTVEVRGTLTSDGVIVEIEDRGVPMPDERRHALNLRLSDPAAHRATNPVQDGRMGIWVVAEYAYKLGLQVVLESTPNRGNRANVFIPHGVFEPRHGAGQRPVAVSPPVPAAPAAPAAAQPPQWEHPPAAADTGPHMPSKRGTSSGQERPSAAASAAHPTGGEVPDLPVRQPDRSYLAPGLQRPTAAPAAPSTQEHDPTLLARFTRGRQAAEPGADTSTAYTTDVPEESAPRLPGDTDGIREPE